jgi:hypothetical protein
MRKIMSEKESKETRQPWKETPGKSNRIPQKNRDTKKDLMEKMKQIKPKGE